MSKLHESTRSHIIHHHILMLIFKFHDMHPRVLRIMIDSMSYVSGTIYSKSNDQLFQILSILLKYISKWHQIKLWYWHIFRGIIPFFCSNHWYLIVVQTLECSNQYNIPEYFHYKLLFIFCVEFWHSYVIFFCLKYTPLYFGLHRPHFISSSVD